MRQIEEQKHIQAEYEPFFIYRNLVTYHPNLEIIHINNTFTVNKLYCVYKPHHKNWIILSI